MTITLALTLTTTLEEFDASAQTAFKANLAAQLDGVSPEDITLQVTAGSVRVVATIGVPSEAVGNAAVGTLQSLAASPEALSAALDVTIESIDKAPELTLPLLSISTYDSALRHAESTMASDGIIIEVAVILGGILFTIGLTFSSRLLGVRLSCGQMFAIVFGTADFCSDAVFAYRSWRMLEAWLMVPTNEMSVDALARVNSMVSFIRTIAMFCTIFVVVPIIVAIVALVMLIPIWKANMDQQKFVDKASLYAVFLILAATNLELLRLLPWKSTSTAFDGLPTAGVLRATYISTFTEDVPQIALQMIYLITMSDFGALRGTTLTLSVLSLFSALGSTLWRGLRKFIITNFLEHENERAPQSRVKADGRAAKFFPRLWFSKVHKQTSGSGATVVVAVAEQDTGQLAAEQESQVAGAQGIDDQEVQLAMQDDWPSRTSQISSSAVTSTVPSASISAVPSAATSAPSDWSTVNPSQLPSAAVRVAQQVGPGLRGEVRSSVERLRREEQVMVGVTNVKPGDIKFDTPKKKLGEGAFGEVYRSAEGGWQGSTVAVKELKANGAMPQAALTSLRQEAAMLASLRHPNVVSFLGVCLEADSQPMLVTEYVAGGALDGALYPRLGPSLLTSMRRLSVARDVAAGLMHIHARGLLHRDLKPGNVLLASDGTAKVADVGLARALHSSLDSSHAYMSAGRAAGAGTPAYMSPEQWAEAELTTKSDVFSYGVMLNEMLTSVRPWRQTKNLAFRVQSGERPELADSRVSAEGASSLVERCWHASAESRPSMEEALESMVQVLKAADEGE